MELSYTPDSSVESEAESEIVDEVEMVVETEPKVLDTLDSIKAEVEVQEELGALDMSKEDTLVAEEIELAKPRPSSVAGFQLVQATGLTDTSTPAPTGSDIPTFATATPIPSTGMPHELALKRNAAPLLPPVPEPTSLTNNPLNDGSKSKQFNARTDVSYIINSSI